MKKKKEKNSNHEFSRTLGNGQCNPSQNAQTFGVWFKYQQEVTTDWVRWGRY